MKQQLQRHKSQKIGKWLALVALLLLLAVSVERLPLTIGELDFRAYWSASYLLARGENFADDAALFAVQHNLTRFQEAYAMKTWNPPWILVWLMPLSWLSFNAASNLWLLLNVATLLCSVLASWRLFLPPASDWRRWVWLPLLTAVLFPSTLVSLVYGQVNIIVLGGLVGFLLFYQQKHDTAAGLALALTSFKPHLLYLLIPILLIHSWRQHRWRVSVAFGGLILLSTLVAVGLRPTLLLDYFNGTTSTNLLDWENATAVTYLAHITGWHWVRLLSIPLLPATLFIWLYWGNHWHLPYLVQVGTLASLITMPFGWSYDFVLLLLPITQLLVWGTTMLNQRRHQWVVLGLLFIIYAAYYAQRTGRGSDLYFFWVPITIGLLYGWTAWQIRGQNQL